MPVRVPYEEKRRIARMLSDSDRPMQRLQDMQFPGLSTRQRQRELALASTTAMERVLAFFASLGQAISFH